MKLGDKFTMNIPVRRKWWQVWRPKQERREYTVDSAEEGIIDSRQDHAVWITCDGIGIRSGENHYVNYKQVTEQEFNNWLHQSRINCLRASIEAARRNKKKSSHLVAELKKLEEQE